MSANAFDVLGVSRGGWPAARRPRRSCRRAARCRPQLSPVAAAYGGPPTSSARRCGSTAESFTIVGVLPRGFRCRRCCGTWTSSRRSRPIAIRCVTLRNSVNFLRFFGRLDAGDRTRSGTGGADRDLPVAPPAVPGRIRPQAGRAGRSRCTRCSSATSASRCWPCLAAVIVVLAAALANLVSLALVRASGRRVELIDAQRDRRIAAPADAAARRRGACSRSRAACSGGSSQSRLIGVTCGGRRHRFRASMKSCSMRNGVVLRWSSPRGDALLTLAPLVARCATRAGDAFRPAGRGAIGDRWNQRVRNAMVVAEIRAATRAASRDDRAGAEPAADPDVHPGFSREGVFQARVSIPPTYRTPDEIARFYERLSERLAAAPGVERDRASSRWRR